MMRSEQSSRCRSGRMPCTLVAAGLFRQVINSSIEGPRSGTWVEGMLGPTLHCFHTD